MEEINESEDIKETKEQGINPKSLLVLKPKVERYERQLLKRSVAKVALKRGFHSVEPQTLEALTEVTGLFLEQIAFRCKRYAEHGNRIMPNALDIEQTLQEFNMDWRSIGLTATDLLDIGAIQVVPKKSHIEARNNHHHYYKDVLNPNKVKLPIAPDHLPALPKEHSYKFSEETVQRIEDTQVIRELNAKETRLVEENLKSFSMKLHKNKKNETFSEINTFGNENEEEEAEDSDQDEPFVNYEMSKFYHIEQGSSIKHLSRFNG
ncbi:hypothetical protein K502DRAFT_297690 [Neoconidiobolus thromboides FSU 785]|nr:hypothetical protein K502DRAFT_297690 [Neoconidiobolus thromboides FSU 785]